MGGAPSCPCAPVPDINPGPPGRPWPDCSAGQVAAYGRIHSSVAPSRHFQPTPALGPRRGRRPHFPRQNPPDLPRFKHLKTRHFPRIPLQIPVNRNGGARCRGTTFVTFSGTFPWVNPPKKKCAWDASSCPTGKRHMADSAGDYVGRIMHPIWPGNTSGSPRRTWNRLQGRGRSTFPSGLHPVGARKTEAG